MIFDLKALVEDNLRGAKSILASKNIHAEVDWSGNDNSRIMGDIPQIGRALRNLITNAIKYSPQGGIIRIQGHCGSKTVTLEVTDQGSGIIEEDLPYIFDRFYRGSSKGTQRGSGLDPSIVASIIERHNSHMGVRSRVGTGTTFLFELPRSISGRVHAEAYVRSRCVNSKPFKGLAQTLQGSAFEPVRWTTRPCPL